MKKQFKVVLYVIAALTVICVIAAIVMLKVVSGDDLFYMDTKLGGFYVASYRWVCLAAAVLVIFWVIFWIIRRPALKAAKAARAAEAAKAANTTNVVGTDNTAKAAGAPVTTPGSPDTSNKIKYCAKCGQPRPADKPFCGHCGAQG